MQINDNINNVPLHQIVQLATNYLGQHLAATHSGVKFKCNEKKIFVYDKRSGIINSKVYDIYKPNNNGVDTDDLYVEVYECGTDEKKNNSPCHTISDVVNTICNDLQ